MEKETATAASLNALERQKMKVIETELLLGEVILVPKIIHERVVRIAREFGMSEEGLACILKSEDYDIIPKVKHSR